MSLLGCHWIRVHPDGRDLDHIGKMQYKSVKLFEWSWSDRDFCRDLLTVLPQDAYILARDHPLSEQEIWSDPVGTGTRHANEWADKVRSGRYHLPTDRTFFLGRNEPDATTGDRNAIDLYTESFLRRLKSHGLRGGAFNFSTGHPRTVDGTPNTKADYTIFQRSHRAIIEGDHIGCLHIYGTAAVPCAPGHFDRLKACPWQDVQWVVGEMGADEHVVGGGHHDGYLISMNGGSPQGVNDYCAWLDTLIMGIADPRIHSYQVFTYDFSHPWDSFNTREIRDALESYPWKHTSVIPPPPRPVTKYVTAPAGLWLRSAPVVDDANKLMAVPYGKAVSVTGTTGEWAQVTFEFTSGYMFAAYLSEQEPDGPVDPPVEPPTGDKWQRSIAFVLEAEGGWADNPNDPGGATMRGITIGTYTRWREAHGQPKPTKEDLRNISGAEVHQIYHEWYWLASGSDTLPFPLCLAVMDLAVNGGVGRAKEALNAAGADFMKYMAWRIDWYTRISNFEIFGRAWIRRCSRLMMEAAK